MANQAQANADAFVGKATLAGVEPYPMITGSAYSSLAPASCAVVHWVQPTPIGMQNVIWQASLGAGVAAATGQASTGSEAWSYAFSCWLYSQQDYTANSSNLWPMASGSFGLTANMAYSSTSQTMGMSWVTDSTGGTSTLSTSSSDAGWSNFLNGPRIIKVPCVTSLPAANYWMFFQHSSSSNTSNSNVTLVSVSGLQIGGQQGANPAGYLGQTTTNATVLGPTLHIGAIGSSPTFTTTIPITNITAAAARPLWFALSNG